MTPMLILEKVEENAVSTAALLEGRLVEYHYQPTSAASLAGEILIGRVERVLPEVSAAFINIGRKKNGFLPLKETDSFEKQNPHSPLITGSSVIVQVQKDEKGDKGVFLSRDLSLPGEYVILMPMNRYIGVSKRISGEAHRGALVRLGKKIAEGRFGLIMRQASLFAREEEVREEAEALYEKWQKISYGAENKRPPCMLLEKENDAAALARDYAPRHTIETVSSKENPERLQELWKQYTVEAQRKAALARTVTLPTGETLIIDEREALQTIDINSAHNTTGDGASMAYTVNLHSVAEAARQIRLRNLSGIILIDFLDMERESERQALLAAMEEALADDRIKHVVHGFTRLGILEMTRKRTGPTLKEMYTQQ